MATTYLTNSAFKEQAGWTEDISLIPISPGAFVMNRADGFMYYCDAVGWRKVGANFPDRNTDIVGLGGGRNTRTAGGNLSGHNGYRDFLVYSHVSRIRENEYVTKVEFYCNLIASEIALMIGDGRRFDFKIWRKNILGTYDRIGMENIVTKLSPEAVNVITLDTPILAEEGDFVGFGINRGYTALNALGTGKIWYFSSSEAPANGADFEAEATLSLDIPNVTFGQAPLMVGIGDSIMAGHTDHYSFLETADITSLSNQIMYQLRAINSDIIYQNMGTGSSTSTQILSRFPSDVVGLKPKYVIIHVGVNDIAGAVAKATYISNMTAMLDLCVTNSIIPIIGKIMPWTNGSNVQMQTRDDWMADLQALVATYSGAKWVDYDASIGQFRTGGDAGNLWDIQVAYDDDGVHLLEAGYAKAAEPLYAALTE